MNTVNGGFRNLKQDPGIFANCVQGARNKSHEIKLKFQFASRVSISGITLV